MFLKIYSIFMLHKIYQNDFLFQKFRTICFLKKKLKSMKCIASVFFK